MSESINYIPDLDVTSMSEPDDSWGFRDKDGHFHTNSLDKVTWIDEGSYYYMCGDCSSFHSACKGHYECNLCGDTVPSPKNRATTVRTRVAGL